MKMTRLGHTDIEVSALCLGTMNWGTRTQAADALAQINTARAAGVNFIDTAEFYPVNPIKPETIGRAERILGLWLDSRINRQDIVIATKHAGAGMKHVRKGAPVTAEMIPGAVEASLRRLKTDYIDLYQFHWPNRRFVPPRKDWTGERPSWDKASELQNMADCLGALQSEVQTGRIRAFGLSNESAWGTMQWRAVAEAAGGPRVATLQNEYSLLCRTFDVEMAEVCLEEDISLLAYSPRAGGLLGGSFPDMTALAGGVTPGQAGPEGDLAFAAVGQYGKIAEKHGLTLSQMALGWCLSRPFKSSVIFGASSMEQLQTALGAMDIDISDEIGREIEQVHLQFPMLY